MKSRRFILPRLGRKGKIVRNLALTLAFLGALWVGMGYPLPAEMEFHRLERSSLLRPSEVVARVEQEYGTCVVGFSENEAVAGDLEYDSLTLWPMPEEGTGLMPVPTRQSVSEGVYFLSLKAPEGAASARLEGEVSAWLVTTGARVSPVVLELPGHSDTGTYWQESWRYETQGERLDCGEFLFRVEAGQDADTDSGTGERRALADLVWTYTYTAARPGRENNPEFTLRAVFYDEAGRELGEAWLSPRENPLYNTEE